MSKIYVTQTDLVITLTTGEDITGATSVKIVAKNPKGVVVEWIATIENATLGVIKYNIVDPLSVFGIWTFWAKITSSTGKILVGEPTQITVYNEGY